MPVSSLLGAVVLVTCCGVFAAGIEELGSPLRVAQCRAQCLERFANGADVEAMCLQGPDCFMCWENCELLQSNYPVWGAMCSEKGICFPGCQQACRFHLETSTQPVQQAQPVIHTRGEEVVRTSGNVARWPRPPTTSPSAPLVYVVMRRQSGESSSWRQLTQTVELSARLPEGDTDHSPAMIRVLVVDPEGLVTIYSPVSATSSLGDAAPGQFLAGQTLSKVLAGRRKKINTEVTPSTVSSLLQADGDATTWQLREVSLIHQKVLVIAEIAWQPRVVRGVYLVTWEVDGGGLKGNLFTDSTCVTLSLWPDTIYHIQVELVSRSADHRPERSQPMVIDTHRAPRGATTASDMRRPTSPLLAVLAAPGESRAHLLAATAAAAGLLLALLAAGLAWRRRGSMTTAAAGRCRVRPARLNQHSFFAGLQPVMSVKDSLGKAQGLGSLFSAKGLGFGFRVDGDPASATNPLLGPSAPPTPETNHHPVSFLKDAERGARNEVQV